MRIYVRWKSRCQTYISKYRGRGNPPLRHVHLVMSPSQAKISGQNLELSAKVTTIYKYIYIKSDNYISKEAKKLYRLFS